MARRRDVGQGQQCLCSLYRVIGREGNLAQALNIAGGAPERVMTDGHNAYPGAIRETLGPGVWHRTSRSKNNQIEQDHRGIKQGYYPIRGFGSFASSARFCTGFEVQRQYFRPRTKQYERVSLPVQPPAPGALGGDHGRDGPPPDQGRGAGRGVCATCRPSFWSHS